MYGSFSIFRAAMSAVLVGVVIAGALVIWSTYSPAAPLAPLEAQSFSEILNSQYAKVAGVAAAVVFALQISGAWGGQHRVLSQHAIHSATATVPSARPDRGRIDWVIANVGRGVHKRIDENRELLQLLRLEAPWFIEQHPWVEGWLKSHDDFFCELEAASGAKNPIDGRAKGAREYPRPWPAPQT